MNLNGLTDFYVIPKCNKRATDGVNNEMTLRHWAILRMRAKGMTFEQIAEHIPHPVTRKIPSRGQVCRAEKTALKKLAHLKSSTDVEEKLAILMA